ncbi:MAG: dienelactone hydrolase family protein, partial [Actinobacteria bacterium]|nr:dienelactone hydrolase family protein [Actinomycetota bacterium]
MTDLPRSDIDIPTPDGSADAYLVEPAEGSSRGVLVFMDAIGLRPRMTEMADRIATEGYRVLVPNLFYRAGRAPVVPDLVARLQGEDRAAVFGELRPLMTALTPEVAARDTQAYVDVLATDHLATVGYCMGGALALRPASCPTGWSPSPASTAATSRRRTAPGLTSRACARRSTPGTPT